MLIQTYLKGKHLPDEIRTEMEGLQCVNEELLLRYLSPRYSIAYLCNYLECFIKK